MSKSIASLTGAVQSLDKYRKFIDVDGVSYLFRSSGWHAVLVPMAKDGSEETERPEIGSCVALAKTAIGVPVTPAAPSLAAFSAQPDAPCDVCNDTRRVTCPDCHGSAEEEHHCDRCGEPHDCVCPECDEDGKVTCEACAKADPGMYRGAQFDRRIVDDAIREMGGADAIGIVADDIAGTMYLRNGQTLGIVMGMRLHDGETWPVWEEGAK